MRVQSQLLKNALNAIGGFQLDLNGYLSGQVTMEAVTRANFAANFYGSSVNAYDRFETGESNKLTLAPADLPAKLFLEFAEVDVKPSNNINIKYGMIEERDGDAIRWDSPYNSGVYSEDFVESIQSAFVVRTKDAEPCGYFSFELDFTRSSDFTILRIGLPLIYIRTKFRNKSYALDLTFVMADFLTNVFKNIFKSYRGKLPIDLVIHSDFNSKGGERVVNFIIEELEFAMEYLKETYPHKSSKIGVFEHSIGY